jgi:hypothetical protein
MVRACPHLGSGRRLFGQVRYAVQVQSLERRADPCLIWRPDGGGSWGCLDNFIPLLQGHEIEGLPTEGRLGSRACAHAGVESIAPVQAPSAAGPSCLKARIAQRVECTSLGTGRRAGSVLRGAHDQVYSACLDAHLVEVPAVPGPMTRGLVVQRG